uniref:Transposase_22 domain-containing protein n=1 Tax=Haemonchus contortus TaxID=6289 RepID=A0A7I4YG34_HAECO
MDLRSGASRSANGQKQGEPGAVDVVLPKELQEQVEAITKSSRIADGIKKVITAITRELQSLRLENIELRQELDCVRKLVPRESSPVTSVDTVSQDRGRTASGSVPASTEAGLPYQEVERLRSVVISGVPEEKNQSTRRRLSYDYASVCNILDFLGIECNPMCVYRLGRPQIGKDRLLKVVLPSRVFQRLAVERASRLRYFTGKGIYLRESLTPEQRRRRREERSHMTRHEEGTPPANGGLTGTSEPSYVGGRSNSVEGN